MPGAPVQISASMPQSAASGAKAYGTQRGTFFGSGIKARGSGISSTGIIVVAVIAGIIFWKKK